MRIFERLEIINLVGVLNALGQKVGEKKVVWSDFSTSIDVSRYAAGIYSLVFKANNRLVETKKLVISH